MGAKQPWTTLDRKAEMMRVGLTQQRVADACDCDQSAVALIVAGRRWGGKIGRRVMQYIADQLKRPLLEVFPFAERRTPNP